MGVEEIKVCPFRKCETRQGNVTVTDFMECLKSKCPAWWLEEKYIHCTGAVISKEYCKRFYDK